MKKSVIHGICICFLVFLLLLGCTAAGVKSLIPKEANFVFGVDVSGIMKSDITKMIIKEAVIPQDDTGEDPEAALDKQLQVKLGVALKDIDKITCFAFQLDPEMEDADFGIIVTANSDAGKVLNGIKEKFELEEDTYNNVNYVKSIQPDMKMSAFYTGNDIGLSNNEVLVKKMIDVSKGEADISSNAALYGLMNAYKDNSIYAVGLVSEEMKKKVDDPYNRIEDIALGLNLGENLTIKAASEAGDAEKAGEIAEDLNGMKALASFVTGNNADLKKLVKDFINPLEVVPKGTRLTLNVAYSREVIEHAVKVLPALMMMGLGGAMTGGTDSGDMDIEEDEPSFEEM
ncbi:MAG: hypothetical protein JW969_13780 [Spirochaetales bacterium]|nr:hypothetical protein [Spirochaetales bacterium]